MSNKDIPWYAKAKKIMADQDLQIQEVAVSLGITPSAVGHYLSGRRRPHPGMLKKLAHRIGVSVSELIEDDPEFARDKFESALLAAARAIPSNDRRETLLSIARGLALPTDANEDGGPP